MKGTWSFRVIPINQIANFYRHERNYCFNRIQK